MTTPAIADLLVPLTEDELEAAELSALTNSEFPVTNWAPTSVPVGLIKGSVKALKKVSDNVPIVVQGGLLKLAHLAPDGWLDLLAFSNYDEERIPGVFTRRKIRIADAGGAPYAPNIGDLWVQSSAGLKYRNVDTGIVQPSNHYDFTFEAEFIGSAYNASSSTWTLLTPLPGTTVTDPGGSPVFVQLGADEESNTSYQNRCTGKWSGLGGGANDAVYENWAKKASAQVTRVLVVSHYPNDGQVTLYIAGSGGTALSGGVVTTVQDYIDPRAPNCVDVFVSAAVVTTIALTGTVYAVASERVAAQAAAELALAEYAKNAKVAGKVSREQVIRHLMDGLSDDDRNDLTLTTPAADVVLASNAIPFFTVGGLTWTEV